MKTAAHRTSDPSPSLGGDSFRRATALVAALSLGACSLMPPSMRGEDANKPASSGAAPAAPVAPPPKATADEPPAQAKLFQGSGMFVNPRPADRTPPPGPEEASLNFEGLDVREVAKVILGDYLKQSYTVHPAVAGTVTFRTIKPIAMKDLLPTLEMLLRQNNAAVVREEGIYKILPIAALRGSVTPQLGGIAQPIPQGFSVVVVPIKFVGAREMAKLLEPFAADNTVRIDETRNLVILAGTQRELRHLIDAVELFDVDWLAGYSVGLFPVHSTDVKSLMADVDKIFGPAAQGPLAGVVRVIPMERLNSLLIITTQPRYLETAKVWMERLDQASGSGGGSKFYVYQVRNGKAENLAQLLGDLFATRRTTTTAPTLAPGQRPTEIRSSPFGQAPGQTTTTTVTPGASATFSLGGAGGGTSGEVKVIADKDTNSLLIMASPGDYDVVENAIRKLDIVRRQVLVEVLLAEVTLSDDLQFGIDWFIRGRNNTSGALRTLGPTGLPATPTGAVANAAGLQLINLTGTEVRAVLNALGTDGKTQVLASPQVMVLDNEKAEIKVGNRISVQTQTQTGVSTGTGVLNSYQYLETGVLLAVTPRINSGGMVTLEINQEVSQPGSTPTGNPNPDVLTRNAKTSVQVASGESVVLGGLIQEATDRSTSGIPLLSKIPIIGAAFGSQRFRRNRTELVMVVTPRIVSDVSQARDATDELRRKLPALQGLMPKAPTTPPPETPPAPVR